VCRELYQRAVIPSVVNGYQGGSVYPFLE